MASSDLFDIKRILFAIKRERKIITFITLGFFLAALILVIVLPTKYTAESKLLLDKSQSMVVSDLYQTPTADFSQPAVESEVEILLSRVVAERLLEILNYSFNSETEKNKMIDHVLSNVSVKQKALTYVISVAYTDKDPVTAAKYANAYAEAYVQDKILANKDISTQSNLWIQDELESLRKKSQDAYNTLIDYRKEHNLASVLGRDISEQRLQDVMRILSDAKLLRATAKAQYDESMRIISENAIDEAVSQSFSSEIADSMRLKYLERNKQYKKLLQEYGASHNAVIKLAKEINEYEGIILDEMRRVAQAQHKEYKVALAREAEIERQVQDSIFSNIISDSKMLELHNLEKEAETYQKLYEDYLVKFENLGKQKTLPSTAARVISYAPVPESPSHPKTVLILVASLILGGGAGVMLAIILDDQNKTLRRGGQIKNELSLHFSGYLPQSRKVTTLEALLAKDNYSVLEPSIHSSVENIAFDIMKTMPDNEKILGVLSSKEKTGKTFFAIALAHYFAHSGKKVLLLTSQDFADMPFQAVTKVNAYLSCYKMDTRTLSLISDVNNALDTFHTTYDLIIIDFPSLDKLKAASLLLNIADKFILAEEWGVSVSSQLSFQLDNYGNVLDKNKITGVCLNRTDAARIKKEFGYTV